MVVFMSGGNTGTMNTIKQKIVKIFCYNFELPYIKKMFIFIILLFLFKV